MTHSENPALKEIHCVPNGKFEGTKFYALKDMKKISGPRGISALNAERYVDMKIDEKTLKALLDEHKIAARTLDVEKAFAIVYEIRHRLDFITEEKSLIDLACLYFFIEDEDLEYPSEEINEKKKEIIASCNQTRSFFLRIALNLTKNLSESEEENLISYLEETKMLASRVNQFLPRKKSENLVNT